MLACCCLHDQATPEASGPGFVHCKGLRWLVLKRLTQMSSKFSRRLFVSGIAFSGLAACSDGGTSLVGRAGLRTTSSTDIYCPQYPNCGTPPPIKTLLANIKRIPTTSTYAGMAGVNSTNNQAFPSIDSYGGFGNMIIQPGVATISGFKMAPIVLRSVPPTSGSYNMGGRTVTIGPNNLVGQYTDAAHGTVNSLD
jgi:hypothetical protein